MSIFGGLMGDIDDDPFLGGHMRRLNTTLNSFFRDPFGDMLGRNMGSELMPFNNNGRMGADVRGRELARFGGQDNFGMGMGMGMGLMPMEFPNMRSMFPVMNNPNCLSFSSTSVMTMTSGPDGRPQVYQASQTVKQGPGGVRETKKTVADSRTGLKKMAIGHHINDRAHIVEREQNVYSGEHEQREDFINLDEEEADQFNKEWETKTRHFKRGHANANAIEYNRNGRRRAPRSSPQLALPTSSSQTHNHSSRSNARSSCRPSHHLALTSTAPASVLVSSDSDDGKGEMPKKRKLEHEEKPEKKDHKQKQAKATEKSASPVPSSSSSEKTKPKSTLQ